MQDMFKKMHPRPRAEMGSGVPRPHASSGTILEGHQVSSAHLLQEPNPLCVTPLASKVRVLVNQTIDKNMRARTAGDGKAGWLGREETEQTAVVGTWPWAVWCFLPGFER